MVKAFDLLFAQNLRAPPCYPSSPSMHRPAETPRESLYSFYRTSNVFLQTVELPSMDSTKADVSPLVSPSPARLTLQETRRINIGGGYGKYDLK